MSWLCIPPVDRKLNPKLIFTNIFYLCRVWFHSAIIPSILQSCKRSLLLQSSNIFFDLQPAFQVILLACGNSFLLHVLIRWSSGIHWMKATACHYMHLRHGSSTCKIKQRFFQKNPIRVHFQTLCFSFYFTKEMCVLIAINLLKRMHGLKVRIMKLSQSKMWKCFLYFLGSGSIDIPVLCMLVCGEASMLEVKSLLLMSIDCHEEININNWVVVEIQSRVTSDKETCLSRSPFFVFIRE